MTGVCCLLQSVCQRGLAFLDWLTDATAADSADSETLVIVTHGTFLKELTGVSLRNAGCCEFMLFMQPELCNSPPPGYFGRFIHMAWASYGGKPGSVYDTASLLAFQPSVLNGTRHEDAVVSDTVIVRALIAL